jgi:signal transduction histidine kinase
MLALLWVAGDLWATNARTLLEKQVALAVLFTGSVLLPVTWYETVRRYLVWLGVGRTWLTRRVALVPLWVGAAGWLFSVTNAWHGQLLVPRLNARNGYLWGIYAVSYATYASALATTAMCLWTARVPSSADVRRKIRVLGAATVLPLLLHIVHLHVSGTRPPLDITAAGIGLSSAAVIYGIRRRRLFNLLPVGLGEILWRDPDGMLLLDRGGRLLQWNPAAEKLLDGLLLEPDLSLLHVLARRLEDPRTGERLRSSSALSQALTENADEGGFPARPVLRYVGGGGERWLRLSVVPIPSRWGRIGAACLRVEDVSGDARAARERQGREERERRGEKQASLALMAGGVAHDFNHLLAVIDGRARYALEDLGRGLPVRRHLHGILEAAELARGLTAQLVTYAGRAVVKRSPLCLSRLVEEALGAMGGLLSARAELRTDLARDLPPVAADAAQLRQVLVNLVKNASEAIGDEEGVVLLRTAALRCSAAELARLGLADRLEPGPHVLLEVIDSGCGMSAEESLRAFDAFYSSKGSGRGLGLAVVLGIVQSHGGAVALETRRGWGTTCRVWLPAAPRA